MDYSATLKAYKALRDRSHKTAVQVSVSNQQRFFERDPPAKGPRNIIRTTIPRDKSGGLVAAVIEGIKILGNGTEAYDVPECVDVKAEWVGCRKGVGKDEPELKGTEAEKWSVLMKDVEDETVLIYAHGGAAYVGSAAASRGITATMATLTHSRVLSINYRLSPQSPFPAQLLDYLLSYLNLIYPPLNSIHTAIPASSIVLIGDSFGGTLALSLVQLILTLNRAHPRGYTINFNGQDVPLPLPAGVAVVSAYGYNAQAFPSWGQNAETDSFPNVPFPIFSRRELPACAAWDPLSPRRGDIYCTTSMFTHPLVCPSLARSWKGAPPIWFANGQERCVDSVKVIARLAAQEGVKVAWEEYDGMCHVWMSIFPDWWQSRRVFERWSAWAVGCVRLANDSAHSSDEQGAGKVIIGNIKSMEIKMGGSGISFNKVEREIDILRLEEWTPDDAMVMLKKEQHRRVEWLESLGKIKMAKSLL